MHLKPVFVPYCMFALALAGGCISARNSAVPMVTDVGAEVVTRHRYRITKVYDGESANASVLRTDFLARCQPRVFSSGGIPAVLRIQYDHMETASPWTMALTMCSIGVFPFLGKSVHSLRCSVELSDVADGKAPFVLESLQERADTWLPSSFLFYNASPNVDGHRVFCEHTRRCGDKNYFHWPCEWDTKTGKLKSIDGMLQKALAYAIAVKLKEFEDAGRIEAMLNRKVGNRPAIPEHRIVSLERGQGGSFVYSFAIELMRTPTATRAAFELMFKEFSASLKEDYLDAFPSADKDSLFISFSGLKRDGLRISGRAMVLTLKPISLAYDANTRRGKMSVKFNAGQEKEARDWIRKNIGTLARDKNIALTTGVPPPAARFYLGREELKGGNVLEIEFKTE